MMEEKKKSKGSPTVLMFWIFLVMLLISVMNPIYENAWFGLGWWSAGLIGILLYEIISRLKIVSK